MLPDATQLVLFLAAATIIAVSPGPGMLFVMARTLSEGRSVGFASVIGTSAGGLVHVIAGAVGASAIIIASAEAFFVLKVVGALYLIWLGIKTIRNAKHFKSIVSADLDKPAGNVGNTTSSRAALRDGFVVEALNPKTAAFILAFIPQFLDPAAGAIAVQFIVLGVISVALNSAADVLIVVLSTGLRNRIVARPQAMVRLQQSAGGVLCALGASLAATNRP